MISECVHPYGHLKSLRVSVSIVLCIGGLSFAQTANPVITASPRRVLKEVKSIKLYTN